MVGRGLSEGILFAILYAYYQLSVSEIRHLSSYKIRSHQIVKLEHWVCLSGIYA